MTESLSNAAFELNNQVASIGARLETLEDIKVLFVHLREDMDAVALKKEEQFYYKENHRMVRILSELLFYTINDLTETYKETETLSEVTLELARENEKSPVAGNDKALV